VGVFSPLSGEETELRKVEQLVLVPNSLHTQAQRLCARPGEMQLDQGCRGGVEKEEVWVQIPSRPCSSHLAGSIFSLLLNFPTVGVAIATPAQLVGLSSETAQYLGHRRAAPLIPGSLMGAGEEKPGLGSLESSLCPPKERV
jgi:hypothetical protein